MGSLRDVERRLRKLERQMREVRDLLGFLPPMVNPFRWEGLTERDGEVLNFLISQPKGEEFSTTEIAEKIGLPKPTTTGRVHVYNSLKRVQRLARRKRKTILRYNPRRKKWHLNRVDFLFPGDLTHEPEKL